MLFIASDEQATSNIMQKTSVGTLQVSFMLSRTYFGSVESNSIAAICSGDPNAIQKRRPAWVAVDVVEEVSTGMYKMSILILYRF